MQPSVCLNGGARQEPLQSGLGSADARDGHRSCSSAAETAARAGTLQSGAGRGEPVCPNHRPPLRSHTTLMQPSDFPHAQIFMPTKSPGRTPLLHVRSSSRKAASWRGAACVNLRIASIDIEPGRYRTVLGAGCWAPTRSSHVSRRFSRAAAVSGSSDERSRRSPMSSPKSYSSTRESS